MRKRLIPILFLVAYGLILIDVMVFKNIPIIRIGHLMFNFGGGDAGPANFVPFKTISLYLRGRAGLVIGLFELVGNIVPLIPLGFIVPFVYRNITWPKSFLLALSTGLGIEILQVIFSVGRFDVDDVLLNGLGVLIGFGVYRFLF